MRRILSDLDDTSTARRYQSALAEIIPSGSWERSSRDDLRRRLAKVMSSVQDRFPDEEVAAFSEAYMKWDSGVFDNLDSGAGFLEKACKLDTAQSLGLMLLLMDKLFPLSPRAPSKAGDLPF